MAGRMGGQEQIILKRDCKPRRGASGGEIQARRSALSPNSRFLHCSKKGPIGCWSELTKMKNDPTYIPRRDVVTVLTRQKAGLSHVPAK